MINSRKACNWVCVFLGLRLLCHVFNSYFLFFVIKSVWPTLTSHSYGEKEKAKKIFLMLQTKETNKRQRTLEEKLLLDAKKSSNKQSIALFFFLAKYFSLIIIPKYIHPSKFTTQTLCRFFYQSCVVLTHLLLWVYISISRIQRSNQAALDHF